MTSTPTYEQILARVQDMRQRDGDFTPPTPETMTPHEVCRAACEGYTSTDLTQMLMTIRLITGMLWARDLDVYALHCIICEELDQRE